MDDEYAKLKERVNEDLKIFSYKELANKLGVGETTVREFVKQPNRKSPKIKSGYEKLDSEKERSSSPSVSQLPSFSSFSPQAAKVASAKTPKQTINNGEVKVLEKQMEKLKVNDEDATKDLIKDLNKVKYDQNHPSSPIVYSSSTTINSSTSSNGSNKQLDGFIKVPKILRLKSKKYEILNEIGGGGFSKVYKIKFKKRIQNGDDEIMYAFKQFNISSSTIDEKEINSIENEIELLSQLKHDNIVRIVGAIGDPNSVDGNDRQMGVGIMMEYCHNGSIRSLLSKNNNSNRNELNIDLIIHLLFGAAQGLEYLHDHEPNNIIHGDIKSDNILIDSEYNAKICDFGISKLIQTTAASTKGGNVGGTLVYKAPEAFDGKSELKSDVYSFGCVILEMLTGDRPWKGLSDLVIMKKVCNDKEPHDLSKVRNDTPKELIDLMNRCLDYDKDNRPTIKQVKMELEKMMNNAILIQLDDETEEYNKIESKLFPGRDKEGSLNRNKYKIVKIEKIKHLFAERLYQEELNRIQSMISRSNQGISASSSSASNKEISANEKLLIHGTSQTDPMKILNHPDAFMKDYSSEGFYGKGLYFAELARYVNAEWLDKDNEKNSYRYNIKGTNQYQMLVCSVICGKSYEFGEKVNEKTRELSQKDLGMKFHSVHGGPHCPSHSGSGKDDSSICVVYKDTQVSPKYLITYESI